MNSDPITGDRLATVLASLPIVDLDQAETDRIRARCRAALQRHPKARPSWPAWMRVLEPALVAGLSAAFLLEVVGRALSLEGF